MLVFFWDRWRFSKVVMILDASLEEGKKKLIWGKVGPHLISRELISTAGKA